MTILSVNKTRGFFDGRFASIFCLWARWTVPIFLFLEVIMNKKTKFLTHGALIAALYVVLTYAQNFLWPESTSMAIQFRASEALCALALFTPAAIPGMTLGCFLFNLSNAAALPLDYLAGTLASLLAVAGMWYTRKITMKGYPLLAMLLPALSNALLVGWELSVYIGGGFLINALFVAIGEAAVLLTLGSVIFYAIKARHLERLF